MKKSRHQNVRRRQQRIARRLRPHNWTAQSTPMYRASNIQYEHSDRVRGLASGGIGVMQRVAQSTGLVTAIDQHVQRRIATQAEGTNPPPRKGNA